jgi:iron complex outermembrane receptor protein
MKNYRSTIAKTVFTLATIAIAFPALPVLAQEKRASGIQEVLVTARRREESLQDTPVAVSAFSEQFIENSFASNLDDMGKYAPNVVLDTQQFGGGALNASIRGLSYDEVEKTYEPSVGVSVDGVFFSHNSGAMIDMFDIESIEILRGPQGTLFGRNTMGGTINIQRTRPSQDFGAKLSLAAGSYDRRDVKARITGPLIDGVLAGKLGFYQLSADSHTDNFFTGKDDDGIDRQSFLGSLLWTPTENLDIQLNVDYLDDDSEFPGVLNLTLAGDAGGNGFCDLFGACASNSLVPAEASDFDVSFSQKPFVSTVEAKTYSLNVDWRLDSFTLTSITAYNELDEILDQENTGAVDRDPLTLALDPLNGEPFLTAFRDQHLEQWSQEIRLTSDFTGPLNFVAGLFYFKSDYELDPQTVGLFGAEIDRFLAEQQLDSYAVYGEATYELTDKARLIVGGRYTYEEKELEINEVALGFTCPDPNAPAGAEECRDPTVDFDNFSPRLGIDYHFSDTLMAYFTYSVGFRSGGWNGRAQTQSSIGPYDPETLDNFEVGIRSDWLDNRLRVNATVFHMKYDDKQEAIIRQSPVSLATETLVENAASAKIDGVELEVQASLTPNLQFRSAVGYLDARFDEFLDNQGNDIKDQRHISYTPEWTFSAGADYFLTLEDLGGEVILTTNYSWKDDYSTDPVVDPLGFEREIIENYGEWDFSASYEHFIGDKRLRVSAFLHDAFHDEGRIHRVTNAGGFVFGDQEPGRTWGVELTFEM